MRKVFVSAAICALLAFAYIGGAGSAAAATMAEKARDLGLLGRWALGSCEEPASVSNGFYTYVVSGREVLLHRDYGPNQKDSSRVLRIEEVGGLIEVEVRFGSTNPPQTRIWAYKSDDYRMRVKYNHDKYGSYTVNDFIILSSGQPTPWNMRCE